MNKIDQIKITPQILEKIKEVNIDLWKVHTKGESNKIPWEICVIKESNSRGYKSFGWFNERKILIAHNGGPCSDTVSEFIWNKLVRVAQEVADELNKYPVKP